MIVSGPCPPQLAGLMRPLTSWLALLLGGALLLSPAACDAIGGGGGENTTATLDSTQIGRCVLGPDGNIAGRITAVGADPADGTPAYEITDPTQGTPVYVEPREADIVECTG